MMFFLRINQKTAKMVHGIAYVCLVVVRYKHTGQAHSDPLHSFSSPKQESPVAPSFTISHQSKLQYTGTRHEAMKLTLLSKASFGLWMDQSLCLLHSITSSSMGMFQHHGCFLAHKFHLSNYCDHLHSLRRNFELSWSFFQLHVLQPQIIQISQALIACNFPDMERKRTR